MQTIRRGVSHWCQEPEARGPRRVIEATVAKKHVLDVPTQAIVKSVEVQTDEQQKEVAVKTCWDSECQTDFEPPVEKSQQTNGHRHPED